MRYGYFDNERKEYIIERPDTPRPWINYLGVDDYAGIVSNKGGGYAFYKSPLSGRFLRFRFNNVPADKPGRYVYIKDLDLNDYWSLTWQPVKKNLKEYKNICRHGLGYTVFETEYKGIFSWYRIFVPIKKNYEIWSIRIKNNSSEKRKLLIFTYIEWAFWNLMQDMANLQYIENVGNVKCVGNIIDYRAVLWPYQEYNAFFLAVEGFDGYDADRDVFIGYNRDESNPLAIENNGCFLSDSIATMPCAATDKRITLAPGEEKTLTYILGAGDASIESDKINRFYLSENEVEREFVLLNNYWHDNLKKFSVNTPSEEFNTMVNIWNQYQTHITFKWSRSASYTEVGMRDGIGYRDTAQDVLSVVHSIPEKVKDKIKLLLKAQLSDGSVLHNFQPLTLKQNKKNNPGIENIFSDDHLWLILSVNGYLKETMDFKFLEDIIPYADKGKDNVLSHLFKAVEFTENHLGKHGFSLGLAADWNDCLNLKGEGESLFSTFLFYKVVCELIELVKYMNDEKYSLKLKWLEKLKKEVKLNIDKYGWDGGWFLRGYTDNGNKIGSINNREGKIYLNSQSWAVISGAADNKQAEKSMDNVKKELYTDKGFVLLSPAYSKYDESVGSISTFPAGIKENGAVFCHANAWAVIAYAILKDTHNSFLAYTSFLPALKNNNIEEYEVEPYVYGQTVLGKEHYLFGRGRNTWLTGTASWSFVAATQYILGIRPYYDKLIIEPVLSDEWNKVEVVRYFHGKRIEIKILNKKKTGKVERIFLNNEFLNRNYLLIDELREVNSVEVEV